MLIKMMIYDSPSALKKLETYFGCMEEKSYNLLAKLEIGRSLHRKIKLINTCQNIGLISKKSAQPSNKFDSYLDIMNDSEHITALTLLTTK